MINLPDSDESSSDHDDHNNDYYDSSSDGEIIVDDAFTPRGKESDMHYFKYSEGHIENSIREHSRSSLVRSSKIENYLIKETS